MIQVEVLRNYENDELFCIECKQRININEKYLLIIEQLYDGEILKKPVHPECIEETFPEEDEIPFYSPT